MASIDPLIQHNIIDRYSDHGRYFQGTYRPEGLRAITAGSSKRDFYSRVLYRYYLPRPLQRYLVMGDQWSRYLSGTILDVGSRDNTIRDVLHKECALVDKNNPNLPPFDWEKERLPFPENAFDTVVCLDTLEHVETIHENFHDLLRVARRFVIISLPNNWRKTVAQFLHGRGTAASYGLPPEKPMDRHKWFFNTEDTEFFINYNTATAAASASVRDIIYHMPVTIPRHRIIYPLARRLLPAHYLKNFFVNTIFFCIEKK